MNTSQLRQALHDLNGERDVAVFFDNSAHPCEIKRAMLVPEEKDTLIKLTDGKNEYIIDAERIAWIRIGLDTKLSKT